MSYASRIKNSDCLQKTSRVTSKRTDDKYNRPWKLSVYDLQSRFNWRCICVLRGKKEKERTREWKMERASAHIGRYRKQAQITNYMGQRTTYINSKLQSSITLRFIILIASVISVFSFVRFCVICFFLNHPHNWSHVFPLVWLSMHAVILPYKCTNERISFELTLYRKILMSTKMDTSSNASEFQKCFITD